MKKSTVVLAAIVAALALTGCSNSEQSSVNSPAISDENDSESSEATTAAPSITASEPVDSTPSEPVESETDTGSDIDSDVDTASVTVDASAETTESEAESPAPSAQKDKPALTTVATLAQLAEPETKPVEQWDARPDNQTFFHEVGKKIRSADSFEIHAKISGIADGEMYKDAPIRLSTVKNGEYEYEYILAVSGNNVYTNSIFTDIGAGTDTEVYEEYRTLNGNNMNIVRKDNGSWTAVVSNEQPAETMSKTILNEYNLLEFLDPDYDIKIAGYFETKDELLNVELTRLENGDITMTVAPNGFKGMLYEEKMNHHWADNLIRDPEKASLFFAEGCGPIESCPVIYTFDKDYNIKSISFDYIITEKDPPHANVVLEFSNFNNIAPITVPNYEIVESETEN